jgi:hypothetical protein
LILGLVCDRQLKLLEDIQLRRHLALSHCTTH